MILTYIKNDANASALTEHKYRVGIRTKNIIFLTFGMEIRADLIINRTLYFKTNGIRSEIGYMFLRNYLPIECEINDHFK